jgi:hypothetical protein
LCPFADFYLLSQARCVPLCSQRYLYVVTGIKKIVTIRLYNEEHMKSARRRYTFAGASEGLPLVEYLNRRPKSQDQVNIKGVIIEWRELSELWEHSGKLHPLDAMHATDTLPQLAHLQRLLEQYPFVVRLMPGVGPVPTTTKLVPNNPLDEEALSKWKIGGPYTPYVAIQDIMTLVKKGLLDRVRECTCGQRWIYAKSPQERHCSGKCRVAFHRAQADWKGERREWRKGNQAARKQLASGKAKRGGR